MDVRYLAPEDIEKSLINLPQIVFEVTDDCNLCCVYCAYGDLYCDYDKREKKYLRLADVKRLLDYLADLWKNSLTEAFVPETYIGFYGGEPLLNMSFIKEVIEYVETLQVNRRFKYSLTTNAVLLDRYMTYLVEKDFSLLISLDGDENANGYRVNKAGNNLFNVIFRNVIKLRDLYPEYYKRRVSFNSVLHDRNDVETIMAFFKEKLSKTPEISELSPIGINPDKRDVFEKMYNNMSDSFHKAKDYDQLTESAFIKCPEIYSTLRYVEVESGNVFASYKQLLPCSNKGHVPTGTCVPFSRKMFVTVNGKILPCERISHSYYLGQVTSESLVFDIQKAADKHNSYLKKMQKCCKSCANMYRCLKCVYQIDNLDTCAFSCEMHMSPKEYARYANVCFNYLKSKNGLYRKLLDTVR